MKLFETRKQEYLTQQEAANMLGVTRRTHINYEAGKIAESSTKYKVLSHALLKVVFIDEEHGILTMDDIISTYRAILPNYDVEYCYLFGSYAKNSAKGDSDVDLLISMPLNSLKFLELNEILRKALKKKVDWPITLN